MTVAVHLHSYVYCLKEGFLVNAGEDEVSFVKRLGALGGCADADGGDRFADADEETALFGKGAGVADYGE